MCNAEERAAEADHFHTELCQTLSSLLHILLLCNCADYLLNTCIVNIPSGLEIPAHFPLSGFDLLVNHLYGLVITGRN